MGKTRRRPAAPDAEGGDRESTHFQQAVQFTDWLRKLNVRYDIQRRTWYIRSYGSGVWKEDRLGEIEQGALTTAGDYDPSDKGSLASYFLRVASTAGPKTEAVPFPDGTGCAEVIDWPGIATDTNQWDLTKNYIGTPSGCWNLDRCYPTPGYGADIAGEADWARDEGKDYLITKSAAACPIESRFCSFEPPRAERWLEFLAEATGGDTELIAFLQRWAGYALSGYTTEHCVLFVYGPAGTGKSRFVDALTHAWGDYAATLPMDALMASRGDRHPAELAMLKGVRLAVAVETEEGRRWDASKIKNLTGGDRIAARFMRENWFFFDPTHKLCVVGNHAPQLAVVDDAMRRRLLVVPFTRKPATPDPKLPEALRAEAGGILRWAIDGYREWKRTGLSPPAAVRDATEQYFDDEDSVGAWLKEEAVWEAGKFVSGADLYRSWSAWCVSNGQQPKGVKRLLEDLLRRPGIERHRQRDARGVLGLRLLNSAPQSFGGWANEDRNRGDDGDAGVTL